MLTLKNDSGRIQVFVLTHSVYCAARGTCGCELWSRKGPLLARSITIAAGGAREVERQVLELPEVQRAIRRGELSVNKRGS